MQELSRIHNELTLETLDDWSTHNSTAMGLLAKEGMLGNFSSDTWWMIKTSAWLNTFVLKHIKSE